MLAPSHQCTKLFLQSHLKPKPLNHTHPYPRLLQISDPEPEVLRHSQPYPRMLPLSHPCPEWLLHSHPNPRVLHHSHRKFGLLNLFQRNLRLLHHSQQNLRQLHHSQQNLRQLHRSICLPRLLHLSHPAPDCFNFPYKMASNTLIILQYTDDGSFGQTQTQPIGHKCLICKRDLSFTPEGPVFVPAIRPVVAVLPCGHTFHDHCLRLITPEEEVKNPPCIPCAIGES
ncbi:RING/U-box superfamily protein [Prunus dulcis]|uniref:RING/U-box superfamily protein n=1 Tax=Prunus dulcis TaxID=3755 RepID=A0A4Y1R546_PRUDU|nr:RING/U-box superfamily protein [Prunus dulcis]